MTSIARRTAAERLAEALAGGAQPSSVVNLLQVLYCEEQAPPAPPPPRPGARSRVAIWEEVDGEPGTYVRSPAFVSIWNRHASIDRIGPKQPDRQRVVFLGESVARGFFYDPGYSPARVLESAFDQILGSGKVEVVDLAKNAFALQELISDAAASLALKPDALVVFAGNNWALSLLPFCATRFDKEGPGAFTKYAQLLDQEGGVAQIQALERDRVVDAAKSCVRALGRVAADAAIPVIFLIPELNMADWPAAPHLLVPLMPADKLRTWMSARLQAMQCLTSGDPTAAEMHARVMLDLDGGAAAETFRILGSAQLATKQRAAALASFDEARNAPLLSPGFRVPGILPDVRKAIASEGNASKVTVLDLRETLRDASDGELAGRKYFLDYCHLTSEGIRVCMGACAEAVTRALRPTQVAAPRLSDRLPVPAAKDEAIAHVLAAVHSAMWGADRAWCRAQLDRALEYDPSLRSDVLPGLRAAFDVCGIPPRLTSAIKELMTYPAIAKYLLLTPLLELGPRLPGLLMEMPRHGFIDALTDVLQGSSPLRNDSTRSRRVLGGTASTLDLLVAEHAMNTFSFLQERAFMAVYETESRFVFTVDKTQRVRLKICCRIPNATREGSLRLRLNGVAIGTFAVGESWRTTELTSEAVGGKNELVLEWPVIEQRVPFERVAAAIEAGEVPDFYVHFAQIFGFTVSSL